MIQITAYLRTKEDLEKWKEIGNKTQFLHDALLVHGSTLHGTMYQKGKTKVAGGTVVVNDSNIKENKDGTISPKDPTKSSMFINTPEAAAEKVKQIFPNAKPIPTKVTYKPTNNWGA